VSRHQAKSLTQWEIHSIRSFKSSNLLDDELGIAATQRATLLVKDVVELTPEGQIERGTDESPIRMVVEDGIALVVRYQKVLHFPTS